MENQLCLKKVQFIKCLGMSILYILSLVVQKVIHNYFTIKIKSPARASFSINAAEELFVKVATY